MLLKLRQHPEIFDRLIFGTDYPLSVFHLPMWGLAKFSTIRQMMRTTNRFDRQYLVCKNLGLGFGSLQRPIGVAQIAGFLYQMSKNHPIATHPQLFFFTVVDQFRPHFILTQNLKLLPCFLH